MKVAWDDTSRVRVGIDLCSVADVAWSVERFGDRYLQCVFTEGELEYCNEETALASERLAARFAAKEATIKVLQPYGVRPEWTSIEIRRHPESPRDSDDLRDSIESCDVVLHGAAADLARAAAIGSVSVSLSHEDDVASAVVVAVLQSGPASSSNER